MEVIDLISATRLSEDEFWEKSALGISLRRMADDPRYFPRIAFENTEGLAAIYNTYLEEPSHNDIVVFIHDDVWLDDCFFADRIIEGLTHFDVVGVAGNARRLPRQPAWAFDTLDLQWGDRATLSGAVAHGEAAWGSILQFGPSPRECELLDGVMLAARRSLLRGAKIGFDPRFDFHFYDMDFCRVARSKGLRIGTWPIALTHQSRSAFGTEGWRRGYDRYIGKWGD
ncbi:MAG: hypothetical protein FIB06_06315 [Betaproteobacteria bacterium]|nr:hypothetical protein [Betaproteobacteria bacterium]